uniref:G-protein coupled receptors family 1 profile domain-containing protein n=1 Tax=Plectus sambesii TaxID=2011161 RepID=A0A914XDT7_9BILA
MSNDTLVGCNLNNTYPTYQAMLRVYGNAPVIVGGLVANLVNMVIFRHSCMRTSMLNWFLLALAICDQMVLLCTFLMLSLPVITEQWGNLAWMELSAYVTRWTYPVGQVSQTCSVYLTIMVSLYRYLGVCHPFRAQRWFTSATVKTAIGGTVVFSLALNTSRWFELTMVDCYSELFNVTSVLMRPTFLLENHTYAKWYFVYGYTVSMFVVPFVILIVANTFISISVHKSRNLRRRMTQETLRLSAPRGSDTSTNRPTMTMGNNNNNNNNTQPNGRRKSEMGLVTNKELNTSIMLLAIVILFLVCNSLAFINNILFLQESDVTNHYAFTILVEIGNILVTFNSAANFFIYVLFSSKYRSLLRVYIAQASSMSNEEIQMLYLQSTMYTGRSMSLVSQKNSNYISRSIYRQQQKRASVVQFK